MCRDCSLVFRLARGREPFLPASVFPEFNVRFDAEPERFGPVFGGFIVPHKPIEPSS
jgi:hypothetical protein